LLDAYFSRAFYKQILGKTVDMRDLESIDPEYHKSLQWMLDNDITDVIDQEFTIEDDQFGEKKVVELKEGGAGISVTEENKEEYVRLVVGYRVENSIKDQIKSFLHGFYEVIPRKLVQIFEPDQLECEYTRSVGAEWRLELTTSAHLWNHFCRCGRTQECYANVGLEDW
jgi:E3 ubiquitin-protein ligase HUWE1